MQSAVAPASSPAPRNDVLDAIVNGVIIDQFDQHLFVVRAALV